MARRGIAKITSAVRERERERGVFALFPAATSQGSRQKKKEKRKRSKEEKKTMMMVMVVVVVLVVLCAMLRGYSSFEVIP